ncbi:MAG: ATP-binding protein [Myxococcota bacterium]|nr:HAMP domain-containing protein [Deltaproteobacteria bacterium]MDQ3338171.1 ATP-binding protein [Myxococcota bacterium]
MPTGEETGPTPRDSSRDSSSGSNTFALATVPFRRRFFLPTIVLGIAELLFVGYPLWNAFDLGSMGGDVLLRTALPVAVGACLVWLGAITTWLLPLWQAVVARRQGERVSKELARRAYRITLKGPVRVLLLRTGLWAGAAGLGGLFFHTYEGWSWPLVAELIALATVHAYVVSCVRAVWWAQILGETRTRLFAAGSPLKKFDDSHYRRFMLVAMIVAGGVLGAQAAFVYYFVPITLAQYLQLETYFPLAALIGVATWSMFARMMTADLRRYLAASRGEKSIGADAKPAAMIYRRAQALPYRLAMLTIAVWVVIAIVGAAIMRLHLGYDLDDTIIVGAATLILAVAGAIYEQLWHRDVLRPLLAHLTQRYRVPVRSIAPSLSLRSKLLLSFGGVVLLACGMALLWGFVQYKKLANDAAGQQSRVGLAWVSSEVQTAIAKSPTRPTGTSVREAIKQIALTTPEAPVMYYVDDRDETLAIGGGPMGAPPAPWYISAQIDARGAPAMIQLDEAKLTGRAGRLIVVWNGERYDLGSVAVFYPSYRGRGESMVRPLKELLVFFLVLFAACAGIVAFTVAQFMGPIKRLEQRADAMARGELADPVAAGGEGDEIGRLTLALEEMRRALRDKLRSTEEVNLDLERAVQMRTADLARKNRELAETLDKLTRAQEQLVRSEKLASIGQLVAGIAHEINNPVNAIVNTVGPLEEAIREIDSEDPKTRSEVAKDVRDMVRVVQRGAQRTKAIVTALHNYSRTDDESVVDFDVDRSIDDSLELLRHLLKQNVTVDKKYGEVGRVRGHAGQINQVFMNLLTNAAQALSQTENAAITIVTKGDANGVEVQIKDNGAGIPPHVLPRIFDPFFTTKDVGEGTGLGLSIVHELVERHGGEIAVDTKLGEGTTFTVKLPRQIPVALRKQRTGELKARPA